MDKERVDSYNKDHCWQYDIKLNNINSDLIDVLDKGHTIEEIESLSITDFDFQFEEKDKIFQEVKQFIEKHEWLGRLGLYPTHFFTARYKGILAGVVIMDMPNAFSKLLGEDTKTMERLISRGACISWSPKNLASSLIMFGIKWVVKNTQYRLFTAYSDPEAKELGTIYQACNFYYLGQKSGTKHQFENENGRWVSDRYFRSRSVYKKIAKRLKIEWQSEWQERDRVFFDKMPEYIAKAIKDESKAYQNSCKKRDVMPKHKYCYVLGTSKKDTKRLKKIFEDRNKTLDYPKKRGA
ncbi:hypothetical protein CMI37_20015 [Candidatus Pacearchaeota archaeon]|nr:hypothetical protein [Candidatus Pacearchaeota archaeon]|tara:strand:- start:199 stop:1083 length:885 start_codon:yes stop_codon:yes gene_type:complete